MSIDYKILLFGILLIQKSYGLDCQTCNGNLPSYLSASDKQEWKLIIGPEWANKICSDSKDVGTTQTCKTNSVCLYSVAQRVEKLTSKSCFNSLVTVYSLP